MKDKVLFQMNDDEYLTIEKQQQAEIKVKGSKFIATAAPVNNESEAKAFVLQVSKKYFDATHNCYAYTVGIHPAIISRYNDAGEPAGTAGKPILNVIQGKGLANVAVVVTRYFGGTKLGVGGLIRAYTDCTRTVIDHCAIVKKYIFQKLNLQFDYELTGVVMKTISQFDAKIIDTKYEKQTQLALFLRKSKVDDFQMFLLENTSGKVSIV